MTQAKRIPLDLWAARNFEARPPSSKTLYRWIAASKIYPPPRKIGRAYWVAETAVYVDTSDPDFYEKMAAANESQAQ